ncbi:MAG: sigma-E factor negative regulatory protein [Woeseiaceae bacterium]|nr:sigma-E factor negative regulatory protein [Woeseiaceae bacterium]
MNDAIKMQISAFVDGELPDNESELLLRRLSQDPALRQQAAEYYAIGRTLRGERSVPGLAALRERVAKALDDDESLADFEAIEPRRRSFARPLGGVAIAATVALAAIFGLQQLSGTADTGLVAAGGVVTDSTAGNGYTVPVLYHELHREGASNINARLATLRILEEEIEDLEADTPAADDIDDDAGSVAAPTP